MSRRSRQTEPVGTLRGYFKEYEEIEPLLLDGEQKGLLWVHERAKIGNSRTIADAHHRFQWIHPFQDTNGRTGRVLDHYFLWVCFGLAEGYEVPPTIVHFPNDEAEDDYYVGLRDADAHSFDRLYRHYEEVLIAAIDDAVREQSSPFTSPAAFGPETLSKTVEPTTDGSSAPKKNPATREGSGASSDR